MNLALTQKINSEIEIPDWIIIENSDENSSERLSADDQYFTVVNGEPRKQIGRAVGSYNHASGLNKALELVSTRYGLFIDPDFFIVRPNWIREIVDYMHSRHLSFFGVPYHPDRPSKYRYFPCVICLFIDFTRISKTELDFSPEINEMENISLLSFRDLIERALNRQNPNWNHLSSKITASMAREILLDRIISRLNRQIADLFRLGRSRDTGWQIYQSFYGRNKYLFESAVPVWKNPLFTTPSSLSERARQFMVRWVLPDRISPYPKNKSYTSLHSFSNFGFFDLPTVDVEQYLWYGDPFGFHIRGAFQGINTVDQRTLVDYVNQFMLSQNENSQWK